MTNLNARASQLAVDAAFYEQKATECWEILSQLDGSLQPNDLIFSVSVGKQSCSSMPVHLSDITTINEILMGLMGYYRKKYAKAWQELNAMKQMANTNTVV